MFRFVFLISLHRLYTAYVSSDIGIMNFATDSLSDYEKQRLTNMAENHERMVELGLAEPHPVPSDKPRANVGTRKPKPMFALPKRDLQTRALPTRELRSADTHEGSFITNGLAFDQVLCEIALDYNLFASEADIHVPTGGTVRSKKARSPEPEITEAAISVLLEFEDLLLEDGYNMGKQDGAASKYPRYMKMLFTNDVFKCRDDFFDPNARVKAHRFYSSRAIADSKTTKTSAEKLYRNYRNGFDKYVIMATYKNADTKAKPLPTHPPVPLPMPNPDNQFDDASRDAYELSFDDILDQLETTDDTVDEAKNNDPERIIKRPRGRAPKGKKWDRECGAWVDIHANTNDYDGTCTPTCALTDNLLHSTVPTASAAAAVTSVVSAEPNRKPNVEPEAEADGEYAYDEILKAVSEVVNLPYVELGVEANFEHKPESVYAESVDATSGVSNLSNVEFDIDFGVETNANFMHFDFLNAMSGAVHLPDIESSESEFFDAVSRYSQSDVESEVESEVEPEVEACVTECPEDTSIDCVVNSFFQPTIDSGSNTETEEEKGADAETEAEGEEECEFTMV